MKITILRKNNILQILRFSIVGIINTSIHYIVFLVLIKVANVDYITSSIIGYISGLANSFFMNRKFTFNVKQSANCREGINFIAVNLLAMAANLTLLYLFVRYLIIPPEFAQIFAISGSFSTNYLGNKYWTFKVEEAKSGRKI